jgi:hypothetical protein
MVDIVVCADDVAVTPGGVVDPEDPQDITPAVPAAARSNAAVRNNIFFIPKSPQLQING